MRIVKFLLLTLLLAAGVIYVIGYRLPEAHEASQERRYSYTADRLYQAIATPAQYPRWRTGVQRVDLLPDSAGRKRFREYALGDEVTYVVDEAVPNQVYVTRIADEGLPYGGTWTFELIPEGGATTLRITENGEVYNPIFRFISRYVMGHTRGIERYLSDLEKRLAAGVTD
ncbi:MAG TPA: SRPBCC family protein [Gemmatimonadaceae bacterium]|nr:SRPBCC family protein [Gemmatimonadaceae bacterium]